MEEIDPKTLQQCRTGCCIAQNAFVRYYMYPVRREALRLARVVADAEEVTQNVLLKALDEFRRRGEDAFPSPPWPWLRKVTSTTWADKRRARDRRVRTEQRSIIESPAGPPTPLSQLEAMWVQATAERVLSEPERSALGACAHGHSCEQIGRLLGISRSTANRRVRQARAKLAAALGGQVACADLGTDTAVRVDETALRSLAPSEEARGIDGRQRRGDVGASGGAGVHGGDGAEHGAYGLPDDSETKSGGEGVEAAALQDSVMADEGLERKESHG